MSWIREHGEDTEDAVVGPLFERLRAERGRVSNILKVHSLRPAALEHHLDMYMGLLFGPGGLSRKQREMIAVVVSRANECEYCVSHHREALARYERDPATLDALCTDYCQASLDSATRQLLDYARTLTVAPASVTEARLEALRKSGFGDEEILLANLIVSYFNFVNRIALGLGVEHSEEEVQGYKV